MLELTRILDKIPILRQNRPFSLYYHFQVTSLHLFSYSTVLSFSLHFLTFSAVFVGFPLFSFLFLQFLKAQWFCNVCLDGTTLSHVMC